MLKELIEKEKFHLDAAQKLSDEIYQKLGPIFEQLREEYIKHGKEGLEKFIGEKHTFKFYKYSSLDGYRLDSNTLILHYYDRGYDCYDGDEFEIPLEIVEKDLEGSGKALDWYKELFEKAAKKKEDKRKKKEMKTREDELAELKRLQEKYKNEL